MEKQIQLFYEKEIINLNLKKLLNRVSKYDCKSFYPPKSLFCSSSFLVNEGQTFYVVNHFFLKKWRKKIGELMNFHRTKKKNDFCLFLDEKKREEKKQIILNGSLICMAHQKLIIPQYLKLFLTGHFTLEEAFK